MIDRERIKKAFKNYNKDTFNEVIMFQACYGNDPITLACCIAIGELSVDTKIGFDPILKISLERYNYYIANLLLEEGASIDGIEVKLVKRGIGRIYRDNVKNTIDICEKYNIPYEFVEEE